MKVLKERYTSLVVLAIIMTVVFAIMSAINPTKFLRVSSFQSMAFQIPELGLFSLAMFIAMLSGGINLSIIASANVSGIVGAIVLKSLLTAKIGGIGVELSILVAITVIISISVIIGLINGLLVGHAGISAVLATLGTMTLLEGLSITITKGGAISGFPKPFLFIGNGFLSGIPMPFVIFIFCALAVSFYLKKTRIGFSIYMIGSNETATLYSGINNNRILINVYMISGLLSGLAAIVMISRFNSAKASYGLSYLLLSILVILLGGVSAYGGTGNVLGILIALFILQFFSSGFNLLGFSTFLTTAIWGTVLVLVMMSRVFISRAER
jgi:simple sugar transport system permease protein